MQYSEVSLITVFINLVQVLAWLLSGGTLPKSCLNKPSTPEGSSALNIHFQAEKLADWIKIDPKTNW